MGIKVKFLDDWLDSLKEKSPVLREVVKQIIDQTLHVLMAYASVWAIGFLMHLTTSPMWLSSTVSGTLTASWMSFREGMQWPSNRWWDPYLDAFFQLLGLGLGIWHLVSVLG